MEEDLTADTRKRSQTRILGLDRLLPQPAIGAVPHRATGTDTIPYSSLYLPCVAVDGYPNIPSHARETRYLCTRRV
jgi:hypothetical protein